MLNKDAKIEVIGAGAIGGITAAGLQSAGHKVQLVCKHQKIADQIDRSRHKKNGAGQSEGFQIQGPVAKQ